jgi:hypothetical protein
MKIQSIAFAATPAFKETIPNIPGKSLVGLVVTYPPGGATPAHSHPRSSFVTGYVLTGSIRSQVDHGKTQVFHAANTGPSRPGPIIPSARTRAPLNLQVCLLTTPAALSHMQLRDSSGC